MVGGLLKSIAVVKFVVQIIEARAPPENGRAVRLLYTMHAMMHYSAYRDRFTASALFQSAALLLPVELKLLGSFMRLILSKHVT